MRAEQRRIPWIDVAKGIGIFFIVWGHVLKTGHLRVYLYAFNVTLFFFMLGYTFKYNCSLKDYVKLRFIRTMIPYYIWAIVSIMIFLVIGRFVPLDYSEASTSLWKNLVGMIYGNSRTIYMKWNQPLWFIPCMNLTLIIVWMIEFTKRKYAKCESIKFRISVCLLFLIAGIVMRMSIDIKFPFQLESAILMVAFVEWGIIFRENKIVEHICESGFSIFVECALLLIGVFTVNINGVAGVRTYNYGKYPLIFCISASTLTLFMALISYRIRNNSILEKMGQISFPILLMHKFPILFFQSVLPLTKELLAKPDTVEGLLCSFAVACVTVGVCFIGTIIIKKTAPVVIGG